MRKGFPTIGLVLALLALGVFVGVSPFSASSNASRSVKTMHRESDALKALACPRVDYGEGESTTRRNARSRHTVAPSGSQAVLLCRYFGLGSTIESQARVGKLQSKRLIRRRSFVRLLAHEFNDFRPMHGTYSCPETREGHINAVFSYAGEPNVVVQANFSGCWTAYNGFGQGGWINSRLAQRLKNLTEP
jgi:hypothetical protein